MSPQWALGGFSEVSLESQPAKHFHFHYYFTPYNSQWQTLFDQLLFLLI